MAVPVGRESSRLKRAARRLRKKGYSGEAGKMFAAAETARLNEPSIMTPAFRSEQKTASDLISYAQTVASDPTFDYEKDIAPLRQAFFGNLSASGLPDDQKEMIAGRYTPEFNSISDRAIKDRASLRSVRNSDAAFQAQQLQLAAAKKDFKNQRETEEMVPEMASSLENILRDDQLNPPQKYVEVTSFINSNPNFFNSKAGINLRKDALNAVPQTSLLEDREDTIDPITRLQIDSALQIVSVSGIEKVIEGGGISESDASTLRALAKDKRDLLAQQGTRSGSDYISKAVTSIRTEAQKITKDATVSQVQLINMQIKQVVDTLGVQIPAVVEFDELLAAEIKGATGTSSSTGSSLQELKTRAASVDLIGKMNLAVLELNKVMLQFSASGAPLTVGSQRGVSNPSSRPSYTAIQGIAKINKNKTQTD